MAELVLFLGLVFISLRIILVGTERIFLTKNKLGQFNSVVVASVFFGFASILLLPGLLLDLPTNFTSVEIFALSFSLLSSLFYAVGFYAYVKALSVEDATLIAPLYNSSLLWLLILSAIFLSDNLTLTRIGGGVVLFIGFFFLHSGSLKEKIQKIKNSKGSLYMISGSLFLAIGRTIDASAISQTNAVLYAISMNFFVGFYLFIVTILQGNLHIIREIKNGSLLNLFGAAICNGWAYLFLLLAIPYLQVTVAEPLSLLSVFVTAYLANKYLGEQVKERIPGIIIILIGSFLLFVDKL